MTESVEALVIGAGPVGLFAALCLHQKGVAVRVVDAEWERLNRGFACAIHPEALELFDELGVLEPIREVGHPIELLHVLRRNERVASVDLSRLGRAHPYLLSVPQSLVEETLEAALEDRGVEIVRRHEVTALTLRKSRVEVTAHPKVMISEGTPDSRIETLADRPLRLDAEYVVAADGYVSPCRQALGIEPIVVDSGDCYAIFEFSADLSELQHEATLLLGEDSVDAFLPLGPLEGRWSFRIWDRLDEPASLERLRALLAERARWFQPEVEELTWAAISQFERYLVAELGRGRVWLAGDAAHATTPLGFHSMNLGFVEGYELSAIVAASLGQAGAQDGPFAAYDGAQQARWRRLLGIDLEVDGTGVLAPSEGARLVPCLPASGSDLEALMDQLGIYLS